MHVFDKFLYSIKIVFFQNQILGTTTLTVSERKFKKSKFRIITNSVAIFAYLFLTAFNFYQKVSLPRYAVLYKAVDIILIIINSIYIEVIWLHGIFAADKFSKLLNSMIKFDRNLYHFGHTIDYSNQRKKDIIELVIRCTALIFTTLYFLVVRVYLCDEELPFEIMRSILLLLRMAICHQVIQLVTVIKVRLEVLNANLREIIDSADNKRRKNKRRFTTLCKICDMHHHLIKITRLFNKTFGIVLLVMFGHSFVTTVVCFFYISASLQTTEVDWNHGSLALILGGLFVGDMVYVCNMCYKTVEEAKTVGELIHKIDTEDQDIIDEVEMFSLQIYNGPIEFNAAQFFSIDHTLIFSIIGGVTTYIIILIQLSSTLLNN